MKKCSSLTAIFLFAICPLFIQGQPIELLFTGDNNGDHVLLDSIYLKNLTHGGDTMLYAPDTSFILLYVGLNEAPANQVDLLSISNNYPNPALDHTAFDVFLGKSGSLDINVCNQLGKQVAHFQSWVRNGTHHFSFVPGGENVYFVTVAAHGINKTIKVLSISDEKRDCEINYLRNQFTDYDFKAMSLGDFTFEPGDHLLMVGYAEPGESGMLDSPEATTTYTFQYATNIPCIGVQTVDYEGQLYHTIQILSQCWMKENLNVGTMISAPQAQLDNNIIEKYCMENNPDECIRYGGVYQWDELMQYSHEEGTQGICPEGWHVASDEDWKVLEGAVDSHYGIGDAIWDKMDTRGYNAGTNLKSTSGWYSGGNGTDAFGFTSISGGYYYMGIGWAGGALLSTYYTSASIVTGSLLKPVHRNLSWMWTQISRNVDLKEHARPIRCIKNVN
ncbi:MAG: hypothetical protein A2W85_06215 [Bacteroidetes bacterium GWF2_41_31]|nr:MAG: hypothetical protein A2W85_06215 [Bacteroidetes bacterium GWF2_41_31]